MSAFHSLYRSLTVFKKPINIMYFGLPNAGKGTILAKLKFSETEFSTLQDGTKTTTIKTQNITMTAYPISGDGNTSPLLDDIFKSANGLIFVCDSTDLEQLRKAKRELQRFLNINQSRKAPLLVHANKADLPGARDNGQIANELGLYDIRDRAWIVEQTCATAGDGLYEGLDWLFNELKKIR